MKKFAEQLKKRSERVRMTVEEKSQLRERVLSFMEYHPMPDGQAIDLRKLSESHTRRLPSWNGWLAARLAGGLAVMVLIIVPALAEDALPGEVLYPVKVRFNEEVRGAMNSSPYAKIEWETERMERRLAEAQVLAEAGRLTPEAEAEVADAIKQHSEAAKNNIAAIRVNDNDEAVMAEIALSSALEVSAEVLTSRQSGSATSTSLLSGAVSEARASLVVNDSDLSYDKLFSRLEAETTRAHEYLRTLGQAVARSEKDDIDRRLTDIKVKTEAAAIMKQSDEIGAAKQLVEALGSTRKLISFMTNLEVRRNVTVDKLVPIALTDTERLQTLETKLANASSSVTAVEASIVTMATSSNDYLAINDTLARYHELEARAKASLAAGELEKAEEIVGFLLELSQALRDTMIGLGFDLVVKVGQEQGTTP